MYVVRSMGKGAGLENTTHVLKFESSPNLVL